MSSSPTHSQEAPPVWPWYIAYCLGMAGVAFLLTMLCVVFVAVEPDPDWAGDPSAQLGVLVYIAIWFLVTCIYGVVPFLPRKSWAWTYGLVVISAGLMCGCWIVASIPLLIQWVKPETKAYFGRA